MKLSNSYPFYLQVAGVLRTAIVDGTYPAESKMPEESVLAAQFGVSKDVIRVSLRMLAEEGFVKRIRSKGTFVCGSLVRNRFHILLTVCQNPLAVSFLRRGLENGIGDRHYDIVIKRVHPNDIMLERKCFERLDPALFAMIVATPAIAVNDADNRALFMQFAQRGIPIVAVDHKFTDIPCDAVFFDEYGAMKAVLEEGTKQNPALATAFCLPCCGHRIQTERNRAVYEYAAQCPDSVKTRCYQHETDYFDFQAAAAEFFRRMTADSFFPERVVTTNSDIGWQLFKLLREAGKAPRSVCAVGDYWRGDDGYDAVLTCHYRLYDDFVAPLSDIVALRLAHNVPGNMNMVRMVKARPMTRADFINYFDKLLLPD